VGDEEREDRERCGRVRRGGWAADGSGAEKAKRAAADDDDDAHLVAVHLVPLSVGQLACSDRRSTVWPSGIMSQKRRASPFFGHTARVPFTAQAERPVAVTCVQRSELVGLSHFASRVALS
jgi:hypothetical protein